MQVLRELSRDQVHTLLKDLEGEGRARFRGRTKSSRWYPGEAGEAG
jgi:hypothetical protein